MARWIKSGATVFGFRCDGPGFVPGMLLDVDEKGTRREYLVGNVNATNGSSCGCYPGVPSDAVIVRYKMIWGRSPDENLSTGG